ncbi:MAG: signal peptidase II [Pseudomonadota bacterium]
MTDRPMPKGASLFRQGLWLAAIVFLIDQVSKIWILDGFDLPAKGNVDVLPFFSLTMVWNRGVSMGLLQADGNIMRWALVALTAAIAVLVIFWLRSVKNRIGMVALAFILGGACGNILDRARFGAVVDFIRLHAFDYSFYVFNIADAAITVGVGLLLIEAFLSPSSAGKAEAESE